MAYDIDRIRRLYREALAREIALGLHTDLTAVFADLPEPQKAPAFPAAALRWMHGERRAP